MNFYNFLLVKSNKEIQDFLFDIKENYDLILKNKDIFFRILKKYNIKENIDLYYKITNPLIWKEINKTIDSKLLKFKLLKIFTTPNQYLYLLNKLQTTHNSINKAGYVGYYIYSFFSFVLNLIFSLLSGLIGFIFSFWGLLFIGGVIIVIAIFGLINVLIQLLYQPILNVPAKFSMYEVYVPLNNEEVDFANVKTTKKTMVDTLFDGKDKKNFLFLIRNNQIDLAKNFIKKCSNYSLIKELYISYNKQLKNIDIQIKQINDKIKNLNLEINIISGNVISYKKNLSGKQNLLYQYNNLLFNFNNDLQTYLNNTGKNNFEYYVFSGNKIKFIKTILSFQNNSVYSFTGLTDVLNNKINSLSKQINDLNTQLNNLEEKLNTKKNELNNLNVKLVFLEKEKQNLLKTLQNKIREYNLSDIKDLNNIIIKGDLFNNGLGVNNYLYRWYKENLKTQGFKINNYICSNVDKFVYFAYFSPGVINTDKNINNGLIYYQLYVDWFNNLDKKDFVNVVFQKYYNSIIKLFKQLKEVYVLKNWISGYFSVKSKGILGMEILNKDNQSVINIYNPFLFLRNKITLLDNNNDKKILADYYGWKIDLSNFNNWIYDVNIKSLKQLPINNGYDIIKSTQTTNNIIKLSVDNDFIKNKCDISDIKLNKNLNIYLIYNGNKWINTAKQKIKEYKECVNSLPKKKRHKAYKLCYVPIFIDDEKENKDKYIKQIYENQTKAFCQQLSNYIQHYSVLNKIKKEEYITTPNKIRVCYVKKPIIFEYLFKIDFKVYDNDGDILINSFDDEYHRKDNLYLPYFYKVKLPYKVCYDIDNIYIKKNLYDKIVSKGNNITYPKPLLGFIINGNINLKLLDWTIQNNKLKSQKAIIEKTLFRALNKQAQFNPEKIVELFYDNINGSFPLAYFLNIDIKKHTTLSYKSFIPNGLSIGNQSVSYNQQTHKTNYLKPINNFKIIYSCGSFYGYFPGSHNISDKDELIEKSFDYITKNTTVDFGKCFVNHLLPIDKLIEKNYLNKFKFTENLYIAKVLDYIKSIYFNTDITNNNNYKQNLLYIGNDKQIINYYSFNYYNDVIKNKISDYLSIKTKDFEEELDKKLKELKEKYQNTSTSLWGQFKSFISNTFNFISTSLTDTFFSIKDYLTNEFKIFISFDKKCLLSLHPTKCIINKLNNSNLNTLSKIEKEIKLFNPKQGLSEDITAEDVFGNDFYKSILLNKINNSVIYINSFYSLFRIPIDNKTEKKLKIDSKINNITTKEKQYNLFNTLGLDNWDLNLIIENMLNNDYLLSKLQTALEHIYFKLMITYSLDNHSKLDDIDDINESLFSEIGPFQINKYLKDELINYMKEKDDNKQIKINAFKLWFIHHSNNDFNSPLIKRLDNKIKAKYPMLFSKIVKDLNDNKLDPNIDTSFKDYITFKKDNKQADVYIQEINKIKQLLNQDYTFDEEFIKQYYNIDNIDIYTIKALKDLAGFITYYGNKYPYLIEDLLDYVGYFDKNKPLNYENVLLYILNQNYEYISKGYTKVNLDTNFLYKIFNKDKIKNTNKLFYLNYLLNYFKELNKNINKLNKLYKFVVKLNLKQIYYISDIYLLDLFTNTDNIYMNYNFLGFNTYTQLRNQLESIYTPVIEQYSLFDALNLKEQLSYLQTLSNVNLEDYYYKIFQKAFREEIKCEEIFSGNNNLMIKCNNIKQDLLSAPNLLTFKFKMTKYSKEYEFEELWKQIGGLLYFIYNNQRFAGSPWDFRQTENYSKLQSQGGVKTVRGAPGNCTWFVNYTVFGKGGIPGHAKNRCENAKKMGYKVIYPNELNSLEQLPIGTIIVFNEYYPTYYNYQIKNYGTLYGHVGVYIGYDKNYNALLTQEMNFTSMVRGGSTLWVVDRRWVLDWKNEVKCFIPIENVANLNF